ncbi:MAG: FHA domain-containing protein [Myxococcota bacterium]|nr:FHA domain-containing protein [Myxococcota bacterium]
MLKLHIQDDEGNSTIVPLVRNEVTIGRQEGNTIRLTDRNVSRRHGRLRQASDGGMVFEEVAARFGTRVNGSVIQGQTRITPGDVIEIGDYRLALTVQAAAAAAAASRADTVIDPPAPIDIHRTGSPADGVTSVIKVGDINEILDDDNAREIPKQAQARLVILSDNVRQREIRITQTPTVIGRTDDNNVQIDHRSISRNHAKIVWSDGTYTVRDLDSANGIRVNGDFYKRSDLHSGDELELGHVVLKFLEASDRSFPSPADIPVAAEAPSNLGRFALAGLLAVGVVIVGAWFSYFSQPTPTSTRLKNIQTSPVTVSESTSSAPNKRGEINTPKSMKPGTSNTGPVTLAAADSNPSRNDPQAKAAEPSGNDQTERQAPEGSAALDREPDSTGTKELEADETKIVEPTTEQLLAAAKIDVEAARYAAARAKIGAALKVNPQVDGVDALLNRIAVEEAADQALASAKLALKKRNWKRAYSEAKDGLKLAPAKATASELKSVKLKATQVIVANALTRAERAFKNKRYASATTAYREALEYDKRSSQARAGLRKAKKKVAESKDNGRKGNKPTADSKKLSRESKLEQAKAFYEQARAAKRSGRLSEATALYKKCLSTHGGMASCRSELAIVLMAQGKKCTALRHMRSYVKLRPGGSKSAQFRRLIEQFEPQCQ